MSPEITVRRKIVNRIEDSDSDGGNAAKPQSANSDSDRKSESADQQEKIKYLTKLFPLKDIEVLTLLIFSLNKKLLLTIYNNYLNQVIEYLC